MKIIYSNSKKLFRIYNRGFISRRIQEKVRRIVEDVRVFGDEAVIRYTKKYDKVKLNPKHLRISEIEISAAYQNISPDFVNSLKVIFENIKRFYTRQIKKHFKLKDSDNVCLGERYQPLHSVGIYIPAGTAPLVSTVYMTVIPAKVAGVKRIVLVSPPDKNGNINPYILVVADLLKVDEIYRIGGAQAIAALAFGTKSINRVDKIFGPGNLYVTEAKRQVFGFVDVDMLAGPTELVIVANRFSNTDFIVADFKAQAEHNGGLCIIITDSRRKAREIKTELEGYNGYIVITKNLSEAFDVVNRIAPEHLEILLKNPLRWLKRVMNASAVFLGPWTPVAVGDYIAGPSHVLPTQGTARFFSAISIFDFMKCIHIISYSKKGLEKIKDPLARIASLEGLKQHLESVSIRLS
ncbi:MAG: histidinol dehydrogenase [Candidatus Omnitrophica bacterium]|nr:histidinol dehydrogenase [Candidatus Omnitrophota bacterium]